MANDLDDAESLDSVSPHPHDQFKGEYNSQADELSHRIGANDSDFKPAVNFENDDDSIGADLSLNHGSAPISSYQNPTITEGSVDSHRLI